MPIIKSAIKKVRKDKKRTMHNKKNKETIKGLIKKMRKTPTAKNLQQVSSSLDKAAKTHLIHPNKSSRLKSRLAHLMTTSGFR
ncbi:30S ribosomal protein S20 [Candidatus Daviesbacteria bacterium]|nr:30S ribosomal protein S20 [Candidatus Daviesbacteria bacterium]